MMAHPLALQLRNLQSLVEIGVDKNSTVVFPAPLMTTISELGRRGSMSAEPHGTRIRALRHYRRRQGELMWEMDLRGERGSPRRNVELTTMCRDGEPIG
jgi:hypothetical protein